MGRSSLFEIARKKAVRGFSQDHRQGGRNVSPSFAMPGFGLNLPLRVAHGLSRLQ